jgi:hypothetical protein
MCRTKPFLASIALVALMVGDDANATLITIEPDDHVGGTNVTHASPFVSLQTFRRHSTTSNVPVFAPVSVADCSSPGPDCEAATGTRVFRDAFGGTVGWGAFGGAISDATGCFRDLAFSLSNPCFDDFFNVMLMTFADPTDFVEITGAFYAEDHTYLYGFDDSFNFVGRMSHPASDFQRCRGEGAYTDYCIVTTSLTSSSSNVRYVIAGGWSNSTSLDNLRFNVSVPEPGTFALLGFGLLCMRLVRKRCLASTCD